MNYMYTDDSYYLFKHEIINGKYDIYHVFKYYINYHILTSLIRGLMFFFHNIKYGLILRYAFLQMYKM